MNSLTGIINIICCQIMPIALIAMYGGIAHIIAQETGWHVIIIGVINETTGASEELTALYSSVIIEYKLTI